ncbi:MAG: hypothetical protein V8Q93_00990 [Blautia faecis]
MDELNKSLEDFVNPPIAGKKELHIGSQVFRVGDKILQIKIPRWRVTAIWARY